MSARLGSRLLNRFPRRMVAFGAAVLFVLRATQAYCAEPVDYLVDVKDTENSDLPNSSVTSIAQTPDGYLWVGTFNGLARFDGLRFVIFDPLSTPALGHARIQDLAVDSHGVLWISTYRGGLTSYREGVFRQEWEGVGGYDIKTTLTIAGSNTVTFVTPWGMVTRRQPADVERRGTWTTLRPPGGRHLAYQCADPHGGLWFLTREGHIVRMFEDAFKEIPVEAQPPGTRAVIVASDSTGRLWAGGDKGIGLWNGRQFETMNPTNGEAEFEASYLLPTRDGGIWVLSGERLRKQLGRRWVAEVAEWKGLLGSASGRTMGMHEDRNGGVWFNHYGNGLFHVAPDGAIQRFTTDQGLPGNRVWAWFQGREGDIWTGVDRGGLAHLRERRFRTVNPPPGQPACAALSVCQDNAGTVWFGTSGNGLCRWNGEETESFPIEGGPSENFVFSVLAQTGQGLWLSASAGEDLYLFRDGRMRRAPGEAHGVKSLLADDAGRLWIGTKNGLQWWTSGNRRSFGAANGMAASAMRALAKAPDGGVWCGADDGTLYYCQTNSLRSYRAGDALGGQPIWSLCPDEDGTLWVGTFRGGLLRFKQGKFARLTQQDGLPSDVISQILDDQAGQLWLGTHKGICRVAKRALNDCIDGASHHVDSVTYGRLDGLPALECSGGYQPACWHGPNGSLWFATAKGLVSVNPAALKPNPVSPLVVVEELWVDGKQVDFKTGTTTLAPGVQQIEFRYTALSLVLPENIRFRYRLEGLDTDWVEAGTRRSANYAHLPARNYRFRVLACNNDGVWSEQGATTAFTVLPYFYQTPWFLGLAAAAVIATVALIARSVTKRKYQLALQQLERQHAIERDRARIAKDIHDDLGAGLTQITLLSELAQREPEEQSASNLTRISDTARKMTRSMDEIVWAVDPQHDTVSGLMDYVSAYAEDYLSAAGIPCRMDLPVELPALRVEAEPRYNLFLALKETLHNIVRHAEATEVRLSLKLSPGELTLTVEDNGKGLGASPAPKTETSHDRLSTGHGLSNLEKRLADAGGRCVIQSVPGRGTLVEMTVPVADAASPILVIPNEQEKGI